jgi:DNA adenine methylase
MAQLKPPFAYFGAKQTIAERIVALLPDHLHYVEPFCGSLAVLLAKPPTRHETINDLDASIMTFWQVLRDQPDALVRAMRLTPHGRAEYVACVRAGPTDDPIETARRVWVRLAQGRGGQLRRTTGWRYFIDPHGSNTSMPNYLEAYRDRAEAAAERLMSVSLECRPGLELIAEYGQHPDVLLYVDPPYLGSTRNWGNQYRYELRSDGEHRELADALHAARAAVVLSGYPSDLYDLDLYAGWYRFEIPSRTSQGGTASSARTEVLWSNRPLGRDITLFDFAGEVA